MDEASQYRDARERATDATISQLGPEPKDDAYLYAIGASFLAWVISATALTIAGVYRPGFDIPDGMGIAAGALMYAYKVWVRKRWYNRWASIYSLEIGGI